MSQPAAIPAPNLAPESAAALGQRVGSGMFWLIALTIFAKFLTFLAQIVLGWKLSPADFGIFSLATAVAGFMMVCREGGMRELVVQRGEHEYEKLGGPTFWLAFWYNMITGAIIIACTGLVARLADEPSVIPVLLVIAVALPVGTVSGMLLNKMRLMMQFRGFALRMAISHAVRQSSSILLAMGNFGVMAMAWPVLISSAVESWLSWNMTRDAVWNRPAKPLMWPHLFQESKWLMFASLSNFAVDWGPFLLLVPLGVATPDAAGQFYWAFSITAQVAILLGWNLMAVLTPALQRLNEEPTRQAQAVLRSLRSVMLTGCFASLGISAVFFPLEQIIWHGKWHDSVPAVIILGVFFPWRITFGVTSSLLQAQGHFRKYAILTLIEGVGFTAAVILGALWSKETMRATAAMSLAGGLWLLVSRLVLTVRTLRPIGITAGDVFRATVPAWLLSIVSAGAGLGLSLLLREHLATTIDKLFEDAGKHTSLHALMFLIAGCTCTLVFAVASRMFLTHHVQEALAVAPAKIQRPLAALLRLRIAPARKAP